MNTKQWLAITLLVAGLSVGGTYWFMSSQHAGNTQAAMTTDRNALYWYDPMKPDQHFDKPGKSPFMDMQLIPKYADESTSNQNGIKIDPRSQQNLGIRLAVVERGQLSQVIDAAGALIFNQRDVAIVQARAAGFVTRVYRLAPGDVIKRDAPLVDLLIPDWAGAQAEFIALLKSNDQALIAAARQRLVLQGMPNELIASVEKTRQQRTTLTITAPIAGAIESLDVRTGMTIEPGATLAKINGLNTVWLEASVPEALSAMIEVGQSVEVELAAFQHKALHGSVIAILPEANIETRTVRVRIELPNPTLELKPGMYARVRFDANHVDDVLLVPTQSVIHTGERDLVMAASDNGTFTPVVVQTGFESQGKTVVLNGLQAGQKVVASGQFLLDSEANLQGVFARIGGKP